MKVEFRPLTNDLLPACRAFNQRLLQRNEPPFKLPEKPSENRSCVASGSVSCTHYVAVDGGGAVRGGMLLTEQAGWLNQKVIQLINIQSPISESLVDRRFTGVALQLLKFVMDRGEYVYAVGMGDEQQSFPRLLRAAGWLVRPVPFAFMVMQPRRFLTEIGPMRKGHRRWLGRAAAGSGLSSLALSAWRLTHRRPTTIGYSLEPVQSWPQGTNSVWDQCRNRLAFSVMRDELGLTALYPHTQPKLERFVLRLDDEIVGWSVAIVTRMNDDHNFGNLVVGTILDGLTTDKHMSGLLSHTRDALADLGAELILTNQTHASWRSELGRLGFFNYSSNYLLALSRPLASALRSQAADAFEHVHVNRGDGDGRIHL